MHQLLLPVTPIFSVLKMNKSLKSIKYFPKESDVWYFCNFRMCGYTNGNFFFLLLQ